MKTGPLFNVISTGLTFIGRDRDRLVRTIAETTKLAPDAAVGFLDGKERVAAGRLDYVRAVQCRDALHMAGLICRIEPVEDPADGKRLLHANVINPVLRSPQPSYAAKTCIALKHDPAGMKLLRPARTTIPFGDIRAISVYCRTGSKSPLAVAMIFFIRGFTHPFVVDLEQIQFGGFPDVRRASTRKTLRRFFEFLLDRHPSILIDRQTHAFIQGGRLQAHDHDVDAWCASLGIHIDSPESDETPDEDRGACLYRLLNQKPPATPAADDGAVAEQNDDEGSVPAEDIAADCGPARNVPAAGVTREELEALFLLMAAKAGKSMFQKHTPAFWFYFGANTIFIVMVVVLVLVAYLFVPS